MLAALSTGHKLGLGLVGLAFIVFALSSSFLLPRWRPDFPGERGLRWFVVAAIAFFAAMMAAVAIFGREAGEAKGAEKKHTGSAPGAIQVKEIDFKITLSSTSFGPGKHTFAVHNGGPSPHNLAIDGPGVHVQSPTIQNGKDTTVTATFKKGTYDFFCAVPGHKQAGMDLKVTVA